MSASREEAMRWGLAVLLFAVCAAPAAGAARRPLTVTGGRAALETVCGTRHIVHPTTAPARIAVRWHARATLRLARCAGGRWVRAADRRSPGDYRLTLRHQRRYVRVLEPVTQ